jgi:hypothetical protein
MQKERLAALWQAEVDRLEASGHSLEAARQHASSCVRAHAGSPRGAAAAPNGPGGYEATTGVKAGMEHGLQQCASMLTGSCSAASMQSAHQPHSPLGPPNTPALYADASSASWHTSAAPTPPRPDSGGMHHGMPTDGLMPLPGQLVYLTAQQPPPARRSRSRGRSKKKAGTGGRLSRPMSAASLGTRKSRSPVRRRPVRCSGPFMLTAPSIVPPSNAAPVYRPPPPPAGAFASPNPLTGWPADVGGGVAGGGGGGVQMWMQPAYVAVDSTNPTARRAAPTLPKRRAKSRERRPLSASRAATVSAIPPRANGYSGSLPGGYDQW